MAKLRTPWVKCRDTGVRSLLVLRWHMIEYCVVIKLFYVEYHSLQLREVTAQWIRWFVFCRIFYGVVKKYKYDALTLYSIEIIVSLSLLSLEES